MIDALFTQTGYVTARKLLDLTALRHEGIASNLANVETPKYKRIDVHPEFATQLGQAIAAKDAAGVAAIQPMLVQDARALTTQRDGNNVDLEQEMLHLSENSLEHTLHTQLVSGALLKLRLAITGRQ